MNQKVFKRHELKYLITIDQFNELKEIFKEYMIRDKFHKSSIRNIYYDTPSFLLIRRSIEKPEYKEKLRIRSYKTIDNNDEVFIELKKKYKKVVYKRRETMSYEEALNFLNNKIVPNNFQITNEINYFLNYYEDLKPRMFLSYEREAYASLEGKNFRITFDKDVTWRNYDFDLSKEPYGENILPKGMILMEVKTVLGYPRWLLDFLSKNKIYKISFSKYGNAYKELMRKEKEENEEIKYA